MGGALGRSRPAAILWDLDGTLLDTSSSSFHALTDVLASLLREHAVAGAPPFEALLPVLSPGDEAVSLPPPSRDEKERADEDGVKRPAKHAWAKIALDMFHLSAHETPAGLVSKWESAMIKRRAAIPLLPGAIELVRHFKELGVPQAIATMSSSASCAAKRRNNGELFGLVDALVCGDDREVRHRKPHPDIFLVAASRLNVSAADCVVVEDSVEGMRAGFAAGATVVGVPAAWVKDNLGNGVKANYLVTSLLNFPLAKLGLPPLPKVK